MGSGEVLMTLRFSRKSFLLEYLAAFLLLIFAIGTRLKGVNLPGFVIYSIYSISFASIFTAEFGRYFGDRYKITDEKLVIVQGIIKARKQNVYYQPLGFIPDIHVKQSALQRILGYGTVFVVISGNRFEIKNVDNPNKVLRMIEDLIGRNKHEALKTEGE